MRCKLWCKRWIGGLWFAGLACLGAAPSLAQPVCPPVVSPQVHTTTAATMAKDRGMLWRLQRDGRTSYLYGTLHLGRPAWVQPGPQVAAALARSQVLALELDMQDPGMARQMAAWLHSQKEARGATALADTPPVLVQRLATAAARSCVPLVGLAGLPDLLKLGAIGLSDARWLGLDVAYGQEVALSAVARAQGKPVHSLETLAEQLDAMQLEPGAAGYAQLASALDQFEDGSARGVLFKLAEGWERGDLALLASYESWCQCAPTAVERRFLQRVNDERNPRLAQRIEALHARGQVVFAAVGALHMTGPAALQQLLAARGFTVSRVVFRSAGAPSLQPPSSDPPRSSPN